MIINSITLQDLRKEHSALSDEVKGITPSAFAGPELIDMIDRLSKRSLLSNSCPHFYTLISSCSLVSYI